MTRNADTPPTTFAAGDLLAGRFRIIRFIARGGMGEVYEADDLELHERVALKAMRAEIAADESANRLFRKEIQLARRVTHPNICRIFDLFQHQAEAAPGASAPAPVLFVTMELLEGETLAHRLKRDGRLSTDAALPIAAQMAAALSAAHSTGIVHRDFKTGNVMLLAAKPDESVRVVVTDFGLAHLVDDPAVASAETMSAALEILGTPDYMAPEQLKGSMVTPATDIYAFGLVLFEMVTGSRPFAAPTPLASALRRLSEGAPSPRRLVPDLPVQWESAILRCLARKPADRFPDAAAAARALGARGASEQPSRSSGLSPFVVRTAGALLGLALLAGFWWTQRSTSDAPGAASSKVTTAARPARRSVAVLGFKNLSGRDDAAWLSTAFSEMLTTELAAGETLRTVPGENVDRMKVELALAEAESYAPDSLSKIRQHLGADLVVFGSYVSVGTGDVARVRLDLRLQDSRNGETIAQVSETGSEGELLEVISRTGSRLRQTLGVSALPRDVVESVRASQPASPDAARLYAEGLTRLRRFDALAARDLFERAIVADPRFPLAHSALSQAWSVLGYDQRARAAAGKAYELSAALPREERLAVEGAYREMTMSWKEAIASYETLFGFFPDNVDYGLRLANAQIASGNAKAAMSTVASLRATVPPVADPRIDLAEAAALETLSDFARMQTVAARAAAAGEEQGARLLVARAKLLEGTALLRQGKPEPATAMFRDSRDIFAAAGDRDGVARALNSLAASLTDFGDTAEGAKMYAEALSIARAIGHQNLVARALSNLAIQRRRAGDLTGSLALNREAIAIRREIGDRVNLAVSLNNIGNVLLDLDDLGGAAEHYEEAAKIHREIGDRRGLARALHNSAVALRLRGEVERAKTTHQNALTIRREIGDTASVGLSLHGLAEVQMLQGDLAGARRMIGEALVIQRKLDARRSVGYALFVEGNIAFLQGDFVQARKSYDESLRVRTELKELVTASETRVALAMLDLEEGRATEAEAAARAAQEVFAKQKVPGDEAMALVTAARAMAVKGQRAEALAQIARARSLVGNTQNMVFKLPTLIAAARVEGSAGTAAQAATAYASLDRLRREAARLGMVSFDIEAAAVAAEVAQRVAPAAAPGRAAAVAKQAQTLGFGLFSRAPSRRLATGGAASVQSLRSQGR